MKLYWQTWGVLLIFTMLMLWMDGASIPRTPFVLVMLAAMLVKASVIGANFMHLRREHVGLVVTVVFGLLVMGTILYVLIAPDALRIRDMTAVSGSAPVAPK